MARALSTLLGGRVSRSSVKSPCRRHLLWPKGFNRLQSGSCLGHLPCDKAGIVYQNATTTGSIPMNRSLRTLATVDVPTTILESLKRFIAATSIGTVLSSNPAWLTPLSSRCTNPCSPPLPPSGRYLQHEPLVSLMIFLLIPPIRHVTDSFLSISQHHFHPVVHGS